jgi:alanyl-tRNA synthetase
MNWPVSRVRSTFVDYFVKRHAHTFVPSSPVVPHDDPTLLFTNAGMNQFKPLFLGRAEPGSPLFGLKRAVNSQKCIRAGGKHNDLEDVGKDTYHHTFFEMLGNWSFGDYFKKEAVEWSWDLLVNVYGLPPGSLYATYFGGNRDAGLEPDLETKALWEKFLPPERVLPGNMKDNFWEMGDTGPCGPCTEIHVDRLTAMGLERRSVPNLVNTGDPDVIEIWNNVFIQFNREPGGKLTILPARHVDTGMGLERLTSILQNQRSNYDTDVFMPIFAAIERLTGARAYMGRLGAHDVGNVDTAYRVVADHIRTLTFAITDGAVPSNEGRGYVLRRILRRAVRYARQTLHARPGFFAQLAASVVDNFGEFFPELRKNPERVYAIIREEEESFGKTLDRGIKLFEEAAQRAHAARQAGGGVKDAAQISGEDAFRLYDTYGFPPDLTAQMAEERGMKVDLAGYERLMEEAREKARAGSGGKFAAGEGGTAAFALQPDTLARIAKMGIGKTEDVDKFHGRTIRATVKAIWNGHNFDERAQAAHGRLQPLGIVLDRTNFYAEMGGQEADHGRMLVGREARSHHGDDHEGGEFRVEDVRSFGGVVLHIGHVIRGELAVGDDVHLNVDAHRRAAIAANHTATHLLNLGLRSTLGDGVDQKGSLVAQDRLRFDFSHGKAVAPDELARIEQHVRRSIERDLPVHADTAPLYVARQIEGLRAVFGETYPDPVRVVSIGAPVAALLDNPKDPKWRDLSIEFCGGTHVQRTGEIAHFALVSEEAVAKGVRRIVALSGVPALAAIRAADALAARIADAGKLADAALAQAAQEIATDLDQITLPAARKAELRGALAALQERVKAGNKEAAAARAAGAASVARQIGQAAAASLDDFIINTIEAGDDRKALQAAVNTVAQLCPRKAVMLVSPDHDGNKIAILAVVPEAIIKRGLKAGDWVRAAAEACGGKGGGKPDNAQGGGTDVGKLKDVLAAARTFAARTLM